MTLLVGRTLTNTKTAVVHDLFGDRPKGGAYQQGDDDGVIQMADDRQEVRDQIKWQGRIAHSKAKEPSSSSRCSWVFEDQTVNSNLISESSTKLPELRSKLRPLRRGRHRSILPRSGLASGLVIRSGVREKGNPFDL